MSTPAHPSPRYVTARPLNSQTIELAVSPRSGEPTFQPSAPAIARAVEGVEHASVVQGRLSITPALPVVPANGQALQQVVQRVAAAFGIPRIVWMQGPERSYSGRPVDSADWLKTQEG